jgi:predicted ABC-type ATPase
MTKDAAIKNIIIIAGPNGAGKTTFARSFLPKEAQCPRFINADLIAAGLSPFQPEAAAIRAGRLMLAEIDDAVAQGETFAFETTLAGRGYLPNVETAIARVAARVRQGGHSIQEEVIERRFDAGLRNLQEAYKPAVDAWAVYDNEGEAPKLIEWSELP